jgi:hypothetical protein
MWTLRAEKLTQERIHENSGYTGPTGPSGTTGPPVGEQASPRCPPPAMGYTGGYTKSLEAGV